MDQRFPPRSCSTFDLIPSSLELDLLSRPPRVHAKAVAPRGLRDFNQHQKGSIREEPAFCKPPRNDAERNRAVTREEEEWRGREEGVLLKKGRRGAAEEGTGSTEVPPKKKEEEQPAPPDTSGEGGDGVAGEGTPSTDICGGLVAPLPKEKQCSPKI